MSRLILVALPEENYLVGRENLVESRDCHVPGSTSWVVAKNWKVETSVIDYVAESQEILKEALPLAGSMRTARGEGDRYLVNIDYWSWPWCWDLEEECAHLVASKPSFDEFEHKAWDLACFDQGFVELEPRWRISALMLQVSALTQG